jgi:gluconate 2-dehydrogenase alpha chain
MTPKKPDVIVVGLGAAGAVVASELAQAGARVVGLEKGAHFSPDAFTLKQDEIRYPVRGATLPTMASDPITWRPDDSHEATLLPWAHGPNGAADPIHLPPALGTGGGTIHWAGACWRFREADFRMRSVISDRLGEAALPDDNTLVDWPFGSEELEPYYDRVEWELGISGRAGNIQGALQNGGNPYEAPRARDYPMPPVPAGGADQLFADACRRLGYHPFPMPAAIASEPFKGRSGCVNCGFCHGFPCHVGAKTSSHVAALPQGLASGNLEVREHCRVYRLHRSDDGRRITGVSYFDAAGRSVDIEADLVVLACYALENARLLLASGINANGEVGQHLMTHILGRFRTVLPETTNPFVGSMAASSAIEDFTGELVHEHDPEALWGAPIISSPGDLQPIEASEWLPPDVPRWGQGFKDWMARDYRRVWNAYSQTSNLPSRRFYVDLDPQVKDRFGEPALRMTHSWTDEDARMVGFLATVKRKIAAEMGAVTSWEEPYKPHYNMSTHEVGTHRMGEDPERSVVDIYGRSHECSNLFVIGGGQFPSYSCYNPTQTIWALSYLTADHLLDRGTFGSSRWRDERDAQLAGAERSGS